jgi:hypothetical protein
MRRAFLALVAISLPALVAAQADDPVELLCSENRATLNGGPAGPAEIKVRVSYARRTVELLSDDGRVIAVDRDADVTPRTIKWGVGYLGRGTWQKLGLSYNVSAFDGTIDRESGSGDVIWESRSRRDVGTARFAGRCRLSTQKF